MYKKLSYFLKLNKTVGIYGIDTRSLTKKLRDKGTMLGKIIISDNVKFYNPDNYNLVDKVSIKKNNIWGWKT